MERLQSIFSNFKMLIGFLVLCIFIQMVLGDKVLTNFLWLVLFSIVVINAGKFTAFLKEL